MQMTLKIMAVMTIAGLLYLMLGPAPAAEGAVEGLDKIAHFGAFAVIAACFSILFPKADLALICLSALLLGGAVEIIQGQTGRDASWLDLVFDGIGVASYWIAAQLWRQRLRPRDADG